MPKDARRIVNGPVGIAKLLKSHEQIRCQK
jgi:hypothetical protein